MIKPKLLNYMEFPDTTHEPDGNDMKEVVTATAGNMAVLIEEHNNLVKVVHVLCEKGLLVFED